LHPDLYNDFKSAYKKYLKYQNNFYGELINEEEIKKRYENLYNQIQKNGPLVVKTLEGNPFAIDINSSSLVVIGDGGKGQERMSISLNKILRIMFEKEDYTYSSYEPVIIQLLLNKYHKFRTKESRLMNQESKNKLKISLNQILYGPPGTGKTYSVIERAIEIIEVVIPSSREETKEKFKKYQKEGQIEFVTFHQSYSYEEFVEGLKPDLESDDIKYKIEDGIFKSICNKAKNLVFKSGLKVDNYEILKVTDECLHIKKPNGNVVMLPLKYLDELIVLYDDKKITIEDIKNKRVVEKMSKNTEPYIVNGYPNIYAKLIEYYFENEYYENKNYILIIDEINRGNISKIFGELITLIEEDKRLGNAEEIKVKLPYSKEPFGVPKNLYIIGTMNTADRSITLMDTALRRRFEFVEMMPEYDNLPPNIEGINISEMLKAINERIEYLYDRDHTIGHAYFMKLNDIEESERFEELQNIFKNKIIPLLQEYFYDDWEKIRLVLNNNGFIKEKEFRYIGNLDVDEDKKVYEINNNAFEEIENYKKIYDVKAK